MAEKYLKLVLNLIANLVFLITSIYKVAEYMSGIEAFDEHPPRTQAVDDTQLKVICPEPAHASVKFDDQLPMIFENFVHDQMSLEVIVKVFCCSHTTLETLPDVLLHQLLESAINNFSN